MKRLVLLLLSLVAVLGCSTYKKVVVKDVPLETQKAIADDYHGRSAWTRGILEDLGDAGSLPRDTKVTIADIGLQYSGTVTVQTMRRKTKYTHGLDIERPLTREKIDETLERMFWYTDPVIRQVDYIRKWGKKTARAIVDHEVFVGMTSEAAVESWGFPARVVTNEIGGKKNEQWVYPAGNRNRYIYVIDGKVSKWDE